MLFRNTALGGRRVLKSERKLHSQWQTTDLGSKRDGLEKAVYRIEQAIKRSKTHANQSDDGQIQHLEGLLSEAQNLLPGNGSKDLDSPFHMGDSSSQSHNNALGHSLPESESAAEQNSDDHFAVDDAENPLQLLARASDLSVPTHAAVGPPNIPSLAFPPRPGTAKDHTLQDFFGPFRPSLDVEDDIDPIEMGLVTEAETTALFS